ncbi:Cyclin-dependent kinase G-2-like [Heracleum sosnowskyi]|uniref:Cyclin-dependent kinase G-2-like n=1 Tax=Heracleum sosnowskyi TaxID=360622 RepID=A0AAD8M8C0_9APIA|nr:Cyclin-dependent kinase G-2-like [Heracleum sosnowskyi]
MDGRGGCCIARYSDMSKVDRIMMKYRPIAPKPVGPTSGGVSGGSVPESVDTCGRNGRPKRRYVKNVNKRVGSGRRKVSPEKSSSGGSWSCGEAVVTLPLLSETPERKASPVRVKKSPIWLSFDRREIVGHVAGNDRSVMVEPVRLVESCVTVECVMDTWVDRDGLGKNDEEKVMSLDHDTCPGIVSDGYNSVRWTNKAYREMVGERSENGETRVWLVMKDLVLLPLMSEAFTCRVRVVTCRKDGGISSAMTVPCDVWRMNNGGFVWRLDIKAALCLGR